MVDWKKYHKFEIEEKRKRLRNMSLKDSFHIYLGLLSLSKSVEIKTKTASGTHLKQLVQLRKKLDALRSEN